jgi:hypothetical protein
VPHTTPTPDAHRTVTDAQEAQKCLADFHASAASHAADATARQMTGDPAETLEMVAVLTRWLHEYGAAIKERP